MRRIAVTSSVVFKKVGVELVLLDFERGVYYGLNEVGAAVWDALSTGRTPEQAMATLLEEYDVDRQRLSDDIDALIAELHASGLVSIEEE